jgi:hypothetical protein
MACCHHQGQTEIREDNPCLPQQCFVLRIYDDSTDAAFEPGEEGDKKMEKSFGGGTYYFSSAHTPSHYYTGVLQSTKQFAAALLKNNSPRLFVYGGNMVRPREADLEDILPLAFPFGTGGPSFKWKVKVSMEECIKNYMRLAMQQFMRSDVIFCIFQDTILQVGNHQTQEQDRRKRDRRHHRKHIQSQISEVNPTEK